MIGRARAAALNAHLTTDRLVLEPLTAAHADVFYAPLQDDEIYTWISMDRPQAIDVMRERWGQLESRLAPSGEAAWLNWAVRLDTGGHIGRIDAEVTTVGVATNLGYVFFPAFWGRGYASEAVNAVVDHLIRLGVSELRATVTVGNHASGRVLEKAGFVRTGILPENDTIRGVRHDDIAYVRLVPAELPGRHRCPD